VDGPIVSDMSGPTNLMRINSDTILESRFLGQTG